MTKFVSGLIPDYRRPGFNTGYSAAHDDEQAPSPSVIPPQSQLLAHDCARWLYPQILALGEKCQHCGQTAGKYAPGMVLVAGGENENYK